MKLTNEECIQLIQQSESHDWHRVERISTKYFINYNVTLPESIISKIKEYTRKELNIELLNLDFKDSAFLKYSKGDGFERHNDSRSDNPQNANRLYTLNIRLNNEYKGGIFYLDDKPYIKEVGEIYSYRSTMFHHVSEVSEGTRYLLALFIRTKDYDYEKAKQII